MSDTLHINYFGHSAFTLETQNTKLILDPFLTGNPSYSGDVNNDTIGADFVALSHGHNDHLGDTVNILKSNENATLISSPKICDYVAKQASNGCLQGNIGGQVYAGDFAFFLYQQPILHHIPMAMGPAIIWETRWALCLNGLVKRCISWTIRALIALLNL